MLRMQIDVDTFLMLGSGAGRGSYIDSDIIVDEEGLPIFPARRLKGLLRESALEVQEMLQQAELDGFLPLRIDTVFGSSNFPSVLRLNNLYPPDYEETVHWLHYIRQEYKQLINKETITSALTDVRQQTSINEDGYAQDGSLRSIRVLRTPYTFTGTVEILDGELKTEIETILALACLNLKRVGSSRNRGWGAITCSLYTEDGENLGDKVMAELKNWLPGQKRQSTSTEKNTDINNSDLVSVPEVARSYSHKLEYSIINTAPLLFTSADGDENMVTSLDYIPGSALHGYYANEFIKKRRMEPSQAQDDEIFKQWFLEGQLGFSNALLVYDEADYETYPLYPTPLFFHTDKSKKNLYSLLTEEVKDTKAVGGYGCVIGDGQLLKKEPEKAVNFHLVRNSNANLSKERIEGHGEDGGIFHYQFLIPGQKFQGCMWGSKEELGAFQRFFDKSEIRLGRSISTQYGNCQITWGGIEENVVSLDDALWGEKGSFWMTSKQLLLYFVSPVVLFDDYGFTASSEKKLTTILEEKLGLERDSIEVIKSFAKQMESRSFIAHWKMPEPAIKGWAPGSSFLLQFKADINKDLQKKIQVLMQDGLGEKRHLGFGQVRFFNSLPMVKDYYFPSLFKEIDKPASIDPLAERIIEKIYQDYYERVVLATASRRASEYYEKNKGKDLLSFNLLGRLERIVQDSPSQSNLTDIVNTLRDKAIIPLKEMRLFKSNLFEELANMKIEDWCGSHLHDEAELAKNFKKEFGLTEKDANLYKKYWQVFFRTLRKRYKAKKINKEGGDSNAAQ